jgi:hypothetical protein
MSNVELRKQELRRRLDEIDAAQHKALSDFEGQRDALQEEYDDIILEKCDACTVLILEGDRAYRYDEGPWYCAECSPTIAACIVEGVEFLNAVKGCPESEKDVAEVIRGLADRIIDGESPVTINAHPV